MQLDGLLLIDKPKGWTSFDVVAKFRGALQRELRTHHEQRGFCMEMQRKDAPSSAANRTEAYDERAAQAADAVLRSKNGGADSSAGRQTVRCKCRVKVGHTGTLDPLATGLSVLTVGSYCKRAGEFSKLDKVYEVTMKLGTTSDTGDEEGQKTKISTRKPNENEVRQAIEQFVGEIEQVPPAYSAIKINGQRAYKLARAGKEVKLEPRKVTVQSLQITDYSYPYIKLIAKVSSGTYIRSLVEDIGQKLGTGAYMTGLRRTLVGKFSVHDALTIDNLDPMQIQKSIQALA